jgi:hypothetical protein
MRLCYTLVCVVNVVNRDVNACKNMLRLYLYRMEHWRAHGVLDTTVNGRPPGLRRRA